MCARMGGGRARARGRGLRSEWLGEWRLLRVGMAVGRVLDDGSAHIGVVVLILFSAWRGSLFLRWLQHGIEDGHGFELPAWRQG